jgi:prevent-host-death family protein
MSDMTVEPVSITARELSRRAANALDRVERGERLIVTRDGEPIAEIIPIEPGRRTLARWVREGLLAEPPTCGYARAEAVSTAARLLHQEPPGRTATEVLLEMRDQERA